MAELDTFIGLHSASAAGLLAPQGLLGCRQLSAALDDALTPLVGKAVRPGLALAAVGGYGRGELSRHSGIDVMALAEHDNAQAILDAVQALRDAGLTVACMVGSVEQTIAAARGDLETLTSLLDARLVCGDHEVYERFLIARQRIVRDMRRTLRGSLMARQNELVAAEPWQLQEPDVTHSRGGLRTLQTVRWVGRADAIASGQRTDPRADSPLPALAAEAETLLPVRGALHALSDHQNDRYRPYFAGPVAELLGSGRVACGQRLLLAMRTVDATTTRAFASRRGPPSWLRHIFGHASSPAPTTQVTTIDRARLTGALRAANAGALDPLPRSSWFDRVVPEWEPLRGLPHPVSSHPHPVDVHAVRTVVEARRAMDEDTDRMSSPAVAALLENRDELLLAALIHDIGYAYEGDHGRAGAVIAEIVAARAGLAPEVTRRLITVVEQHQLLATTASRRNIGDERVVAGVADLVGDSPTLHLLYLLSIADARASSADAWDPWKAAQLRTLYVRVLEHLIAAGNADVSPVARRHDAVVSALSGRFDVDVVEQHLSRLPASYLLATQPEVVGLHLALIAEAAGATALRRDRQGELERLTVVSPDRPGILSLLAGTLAVHDISILGGTAYSRDNGIAIDVLYIRDGQGQEVEESRWLSLAEAIPQALLGAFPIDERLAAAAHVSRGTPLHPIATTVHVDNSDSDDYTIIEVTAADRIGLLYAVTRALHALRLDIHLAKVDTLGSEVVDAFYVLRENRQRVEAPDEIERVQRRIVEAITALDA